MTRAISTFKTFGAKQYKYWSSYASKREAANEAKTLRKRGQLARFSKFANVYVVYFRKG